MGGGLITAYFSRPVSPGVLTSSPSQATLSQYRFGKDVNSRIQAAGWQWRDNGMSPVSRSILPQQIGQLGDVDRDPPRLIAR